MSSQSKIPLSRPVLARDSSPARNDTLRDALLDVDAPTNFYCCQSEISATAQFAHADFAERDSGFEISEATRGETGTWKFESTDVRAQTRRRTSWWTFSKFVANRNVTRSE